MSQHSQRTQRGPSTLSIVGLGAAVTFSAVAVLAMTFGEVVDRRHILGAMLGTALAGILIFQLTTRIEERRAISRRTWQAAQDLARQRAAYTGTWIGAMKQRLTVRWEPRMGRYLVHGWISDDWQVEPEMIWRDRERLVCVLAELERSGEMTPFDDEGTRGIRARLDLPGWDDPKYVSGGPVALRPIGVPVLRPASDAPTEKLPRVR